MNLRDQSPDMLPYYNFSTVKDQIVYRDTPDFGHEIVQIPCIVRWNDDRPGSPRDEKCIVVFQSHEEYRQAFGE